MVVVIEIYGLNNYRAEDSWLGTNMPHRTRPLKGLLLFTGINFVLVQTITPVY